MGKTPGASSSRGGGRGLGASGGAMSHAYIQYPPLRCDIPGAAGVMYDDGNKLLLVPAPSKVITADFSSKCSVMHAIMVPPLWIF